uniref:ATPase subunit 8 n=1 Tax=Meschia woodwardi TaxID=2813447 RepID=A0A8T9ZXX0_9HEMI|nr:ATPase subunit 8 [Meschia woodwardi]
MPQMSPLWWEILFIMFILSFMFINMIMFWGIDSMMETKKFKLNNKVMNWKW